MPTTAPETLLVLCLAVVFLGLLVELNRFDHCPVSRAATRRDPQPLRPRTPDNCPHCRQAANTPAPAATPAVIPYAQLKSSRGRKKRIDTAGYACPYLDCGFFNNADPAVHALVGYGHHGPPDDPIQDLYCQACRRKFTARRHTPLYRLKTPPAQIAQVLYAVAEGLSPCAAARVFNLSETTVRSWITRAGQHSRCLHNRFLRALQLTHVQLDELRLKLHGAADAAWLWVTCDARTKLIPAFQLGPRTQALAHELIHELAARLTPDCLPVFSSDGLALYFYALTAHFGAWVQNLGERHRRWTVNVQLLYAQVIKRYRHRRVAEVRHQVQLGTPEAYRLALRALGFSGRIQTAFIERLNLTPRRSIAGLARRSWSTAHSLSELALQFEWWRAVYHFARPHASLRQLVNDNSTGSARPRYRLRTPAQAAGLVARRWSVQQLLSYPAPPLPSAG
jgi:IS1 family transposase